MAFATVADHHNPDANPNHSNHLHVDSLPLIDLRLLSQSDLYSLSLASPSSSSSSLSRRFDDDVLIPKIDRSVFNESAGSRKQTYSRLRLAPRNSSQFPISAVPKSRSVAAHSHSRDPETLQIIALLKQLFPSDQNDDALVSVPVLLEQNYDYTPGHSVPVDLGTKRKRGRRRKDANAAVMAYPMVNADLLIENRIGGDDTTPGIVVSSSDGKRKRGRPRRDEDGVLSVVKRERKASVKVKVEEEAGMVMENEKGVVVDVAALGNADDLFNKELRKRTEGMETEAELLGFLKGLDGEWSSARKKRKIVKASHLGDSLPRHWKILLALKRNGGHVWLFCKQYLSPNGQQFVSCKEVSTFLISYFGVGDQSKPGLTDGMHRDTNLTFEGESKADELVSCSLMPITSVSSEKQEILFHTVNSRDIRPGEAMGMPNKFDPAKTGVLQGSAFNLTTNDKLEKVLEATDVDLSYGGKNVFNCSPDGLNDGFKASVSSIYVPKLDVDSALSGTGKECRIDNIDCNQLTSSLEDTKMDDVDGSRNGRLIAGTNESHIGPEVVYSNVKQQSTSEMCSLVPSIMVQSLHNRGSERGLYSTSSESFPASYEPKFDNSDISGNDDKTISFGSDHAMADMDGISEHVTSTGSCSNVPAPDGESCIALGNAKNPSFTVEQLWHQKSFQSNVSTSLVDQDSRTAMVCPSGRSSNLVNNLNNTSSHSMGESTKDEVNRSWNDGVLLTFGSSHAGLDASSMTSTVHEKSSEASSLVHFENSQTFCTGNNEARVLSSSVLVDKLIGDSVNGLICPNASDQSLTFENNLSTAYNSRMSEQPNIESAEKPRNNDSMAGFLNHSQPSGDVMADLMWRFDEQNVQQSGLADTSSELIQSSGCYPNFDMMSGKGANGDVGENEKFDNMSGLEGPKPGRIEEAKVLSYDGEMEQGFDSSAWLDKESLPSMPNIASRREIHICVWCGNEFYHEVYEAETQNGSVSFICATCQGKFSGQFNYL